MNRNPGTILISVLCFLGVGMLAASFGPALPDLAARSGSPVGELGSIFTAFFLGAFLSISTAGALADRIGQGPVLVGGAVLAALGIAGISLAGGLPAMLAFAALTGVGHGAVDVSNNVMVARLFADRAVAMLNLLNVFFGVGAMAGPALAGIALKQGGTGLAGLWGAAGTILLAAVLVLLLFRPAGATAARQGEGPGGSLSLRSPLLWSYGLLMILCVGILNGMGGWSTAYLTETTSLDTGLAAWVTSGFWMASTAGRLLGAGLGTRLSPMGLLRLFLFGAALGGIALVLGTGSAPITVGALLLLGFAFGPVFPTMVGLATRTFPEAPGSAGSFVMSMGTVGGMLLPWVQGLLMAGAGPRASVALIAAGALGMLALQGVARRLLQGSGRN